jgi:hypothetical protein
MGQSSHCQSRPAATSQICSGFRGSTNIIWYVNAHTPQIQSVASAAASQAYRALEAALHHSQFHYYRGRQ